MLGASDSLGATPGTSRDGQVILENARQRLRVRICSSAGVSAAHRAAGSSKVQLVAAVLDCIAGTVTGVSPITVAVLLVKEGLDGLCAEIWRDGHRPG